MHCTIVLLWQVNTANCCLSRVFFFFFFFTAESSMGRRLSLWSMDAEAMFLFYTTIVGFRAMPF